MMTEEQIKKWLEESKEQLAQVEDQEQESVDDLKSEIATLEAILK